MGDCCEKFIEPSKVSDKEIESPYEMSYEAWYQRRDSSGTVAL